MLPAITLRSLTLALAASLLPGAVAVAQLPAASERPQLPARTSLGVDLAYTGFTMGTDPWKLGALSLARRGSAGSAIARVSLAQRFGIGGAQYEADAYPRLGASTYAYLNAGYSAASIFPQWRFGGELFTILPGAYEASLGLRHLRFAGEPVTLYTGAVGKYAGNYWFSLRPYVRALGGNTSASAGLTARRYYATADEYVGGHIGYGNTPSDRLVATELTRTSSVNAGVQASRGLAGRVIGTWAVNIERERLDAFRVRNRVELNAGTRLDF